MENKQQAIEFIDAVYNLQRLRSEFDLFFDTIDSLEQNLDVEAKRVLLTNIRQTLASLGQEIDTAETRVQELLPSAQMFRDASSVEPIPPYENDDEASTLLPHVQAFRDTLSVLPDPGFTDDLDGDLPNGAGVVSDLDSTIPEYLEISKEKEVENQIISSADEYTDEENRLNWSVGPTEIAATEPKSYVDDTSKVILDVNELVSAESDANKPPDLATLVENRRKSIADERGTLLGLGLKEEMEHHDNIDDPFTDDCV